MLALHALGALDGDERAAVTSHLDDCRVCGAELADLEAVAAELARAARPLRPSAEVTGRILAAAPAGEVRGREARVRASGAGRRWRLLPLAASVAAVAVIGVLLVAHVALQRRLDHASTMLARGRDLLEFMALPEVDTVSLAAISAASDARALVAYDRRSGRVAVLAFDLPPPPAGHVYQLWRIAAGVRSGVVFSTDAGGRTLLREQWAPEEGEIPVFAVTVEPAPGVEDPTGRILLLGGTPRARPAVGH
jgi:anti-sigma-K factor RskA